MTAEIDWARSQRLDPPAYVAAASSARRTALPAADVAAHYGAYEALKRKRRLVDFDDLLSQGIADLRRDPAYAAAMRWRFRHVFVDEFQDVNPLQYRAARCLGGWTRRPVRGGGPAPGHLRLDRERMGAGWRTSRSTIRAPRWCTSAGATAPAPRS